VPGSEILSVSCGISSAISWGAADFSGGLASRKCNEFTVVLFSQLIGAAFLIGLTMISNESIPRLQDLLFGAIGGVSGSMGLFALYRAFARGRMGVVAPVSAIITAIIPIVFAFTIHGLPKQIQLLGFVLALLAVWLISYAKGDTGIKKNELGLPVLAGIGFGIYFIFLGMAAEDTITWPLLSARGASLGVYLTLFIFQKNTIFPSKNQLPLIALAGVLDMGGNAFFALAAHLGRLDISAILSSLYPAVTVILAWTVLKERLLPRQWIGVTTAMVALVCIAF